MRDSEHRRLWQPKSERHQPWLIEQPSPVMPGFSDPSLTIPGSPAQEHPCTHDSFRSPHTPAPPQESAPHSLTTYSREARPHGPRHEPRTASWLSAAPMGNPIRPPLGYTTPPPPRLQPYLHRSVPNPVQLKSTRFRGTTGQAALFLTHHCVHTASPPFALPPCSTSGQVGPVSSPLGILPSPTEAVHPIDLCLMPDPSQLRHPVQLHCVHTPRTS